MKKLCLLVFIIACFILAGCFSPYGGEMGTITINLGGSAGRFSTGFNNAIDTNVFDFSYDIKVIPVNGGTAITIPAVPGSAIVSRSVPAGTYDIVVQTFANGWDYANGSLPNFTVEAGKSNIAIVPMQRLSHAIVLSIPKDEFSKGHIFPPVLLSSPTPPEWPITVYNYTGGDVTLTIPPPTGFALTGTTSGTIPSDNSRTFTLSPTTTTTTGRRSAMLTITAGGFSQIAPLSAIVADRVITHAGTGTDGLAGLSTSAAGQYFVLANNIDLQNIAWTPIPTTGTFNGTLDGNGFTISGLFINIAVNAADADYNGLFAEIGASGKVINLGVKGSVTARDYVGGIAGVVLGAVENCYSDVAVTGRQYVGGIAGEIGSGSVSTGTMQNCYATGSVTGIYDTSFPGITSSRVGGIAGRVRSGNTAANNVALNPSISRNMGNQGTFGRVVGEAVTTAPAAVLNNNHANSGMQFIPGPTVQDLFTVKNHDGKDGADFTNSGRGAWGTAGPDWNIHNSKEEAQAAVADMTTASPSFWNASVSPWYWDASAGRPRLWND